MEYQPGGDGIAPKQTDRSQAEWKEKKKHRAKMKNRMSAFPGSAEFPRCRLKLEEDEAKQMKERMSNKKSSDSNDDEKINPQRDNFPKHKDKLDAKKSLNGRCEIAMSNFRYVLGNDHFLVLSPLALFFCRKRL